MSDPHTAPTHRYNSSSIHDMKLIGLLLLLSGGGIVIGALLMLRGTAFDVFTILGVAVEVLGFALFSKAHLPATEEKG